jgi:hypothetical protein
MVYFFGDHGNAVVESGYLYIFQIIMSCQRRFNRNLS